MDRQIKHVEDNKDKQKTYAFWKSRYKLALNHGFFIEALMIDYSMIEDRLRSFLYHIGVFNTRESTKADNKKVKKELKSIIGYNMEISTGTLEEKIRLVRLILVWSSETEHAEGKYQLALKAQCECLDIDECFSLLDEIDKRRQYRNEVAHALLNKNLEDFEAGIEDQARIGKRLAERLDNQVKILKRGNKIRRSIGLKG